MPAKITRYIKFQRGEEIHITLKLILIIAFSCLFDVISTMPAAKATFRHHPKFCLRHIIFTAYCAMLLDYRSIDEAGRESQHTAETALYNSQDAHSLASPALPMTAVVLTMLCPG